MVTPPVTAPKAKTASRATPADASRLPQQRPVQPGLSSAKRILALQRTVGNQAVLRLLAEKIQDLPRTTPADGQPKTQIAPMDESLGREADQIADAVVAGPRVPVQPPAASRPEPGCEQKHERTTHRKEAGPAAVAPTEAPA